MEDNKETELPSSLEELAKELAKVREFTMEIMRYFMERVDRLSGADIEHRNTFNLMSTIFQGMSDRIKKLEEKDKGGSGSSGLTPTTAPEPDPTPQPPTDLSSAEKYEPPTADKLKSRIESIRAKSLNQNHNPTNRPSY